jgi:hypothetical protein
MSAADVSELVAVTPSPVEPRTIDRSTPTAIVPGDPMPIEVTCVATAAAAPASVA